MRLSAPLLLAGLAILCMGNYKQQEWQLLASVVCAEAKGAPRGERRWIMHVAMNRVKHPYRWGTSLSEVLLSPKQFAKPVSPWCKSELPDPPSRPDGGQGWSPYFIEKHEQLMSEIYRDAETIASGNLDDPTGGAVYFHARKLGTIWPHLIELETPKTWMHRFFTESAN